MLEEQRVPPVLLTGVDNGGLQEDNLHSVSNYTKAGEVGLLLPNLALIADRVLFPAPPTLLPRG